MPSRSGAAVSVLNRQHPLAQLHAVPVHARPRRGDPGNNTPRRRS